MKKLIISILLGALFIPAMAQKEVQKEQQKDVANNPFADLLKDWNK